MMEMLSEWRARLAGWSSRARSSSPAQLTGLTQQDTGGWSQEKLGSRHAPGLLAGQEAGCVADPIG